jgi:hypothetical protein
LVSGDETDDEGDGDVEEFELDVDVDERRGVSGLVRLPIIAVGVEFDVAIYDQV